MHCSKKEVKGGWITTEAKCVSVTVTHSERVTNFLNASQLQVLILRSGLLSVWNFTVPSCVCAVFLQVLQFPPSCLKGWLAIQNCPHVWTSVWMYAGCTLITCHPIQIIILPPTKCSPNPPCPYQDKAATKDKSADLLPKKLIFYIFETIV